MHRLGRQRAGGARARAQACGRLRPRWRAERGEEHAVIRVAENGSVFGGEEGDVVYDETVVEKRRENEPMESGALADLPTRNRARGQDDYGLQLEAFRFTIADNLLLIWGDVLNLLLWRAGRAGRGTSVIPGGALKARSHAPCEFGPCRTWRKDKTT
jgi:hypothetical protein